MSPKAASSSGLCPSCGFDASAPPEKSPSSAEVQAAPEQRATELNEVRMRWICMLRTSASHRLRSKSWTAPFPRRLCSGSALSVSWILARCHRGWVNYLGEVDDNKNAQRFRAVSLSSKRCAAKCGSSPRSKHCATAGRHTGGSGGAAATIHSDSWAAGLKGPPAAGVAAAQHARGGGARRWRASALHQRAPVGGSCPLRQPLGGEGG